MQLVTLNLFIDVNCPDYFQTKMYHSYYDLYIKRQNYLTELVDIFIQTSFKNKIYNLYAF